MSVPYAAHLKQAQRTSANEVTPCEAQTEDFKRAQQTWEARNLHKTLLIPRNEIKGP